jgi:branched-chain amino acid transport system ATP-binding protein/branched-chain amino acid transport system permease protein
VTPLVALRRHWIVRSSLGAALLSAGLLAVAGWGWSANEARQGQIITFFLSAMVVVALQIFSGNSGILSLGHLTFVGIGAYTAGILMLDPSLKEGLTGLPGFVQSGQLSFFPATVITALFVGLVALFLGLPVIRLAGASAVIAIFSLLLIANVVFANWTSVTRGAGGIYAVPFVTTVGWAVGWTIVAVFAARLFKDAAAGIELQASREDELAAPAVGVRVRALRLGAWVLSAMVAGVSGALLAGYLTTFSPANFYLQQTFIILVMFIVGGMSTVGGALVGAGLVTLVQEWLRGYESTSIDLGLFSISRLTGLTQIALVFMILAVMYFRREGIVARYEPDESLGLLLLRRRQPPWQDTGEPEDEAGGEDAGQ